MSCLSRQALGARWLTAVVQWLRAKNEESLRLCSLPQAASQYKDHGVTRLPFDRAPPAMILLKAAPLLEPVLSASVEVDEPFVNAYICRAAYLIQLQAGLQTTDCGHLVRSQLAPL